MNLRAALELHGPAMNESTQFSDENPRCYICRVAPFPGEFSGEEPLWTYEEIRGGRKYIQHVHSPPAREWVCLTCVSTDEWTADSGASAEWPCATWIALTEEA